MSEKWQIVGKEFLGQMLNEAYIISQGEYSFSIYEDEDEVRKLVALLNKLNDENEHLKEYLGDLEADVKLVEKENEQLRNTNEELKKDPKQEDWDLLINQLSELSIRNVKLWEKNAELQNKIDRTKEKNYD